MSPDVIITIESERGDVKETFRFPEEAAVQTGLNLNYCLDLEDQFVLSSDSREVIEKFAKTISEAAAD